MTSTPVAGLPPSGGAGLRIATLNAWGVRGDWQHRRAPLAEGFAALNADLITLQETIATATYDQTSEFLPAGYHTVHQTRRESDGQGVTTASRWPTGRVVELDLHVTPRGHGFASTSLIVEILAPASLGRIWLVNHLPDWQLQHEHERRLQAVRAARALEELTARRPGHVIVAGDFDADPDADSVRFWTGHHVIDGMSVCYRDAWHSCHPDEPGHTFVPDNPNAADWDWPFRRIDYILVRCGQHGGPTLRITGCERIFDQPGTTISDHYGLTADLELPDAPA
jgi:endonuclease/exonuclease/phosphatase family metal-dependent hydrolase